MAEQTVVEQQTQAVPEQKVETPAPAAQAVEKQEAVKTEESIVTRASKYKAPETKKEPENSFGLTKELYEKVQGTPELAAIYKSLQADYTRKTQEASELRKKADEVLKQSSTWTVERMQQEINKPDFIKAAQQYAQLQNPPGSGLTDQEYSALTDKEKAQLNSMRQELDSMRMQNFQMQQRQMDEQLKSKYANYAPDIVDTAITRLVSKEAVATREDIWKAIDYDDAVQRAYELGKQDRALQTQEKQHSVSFDGINTTQHSETPQPEKGESGSAYFRRLAQNRLAEVQRQKQTR